MARSIPGMAEPRDHREIKLLLPLRSGKFNVRIAARVAAEREIFENSVESFCFGGRILSRIPRVPNNSISLLKDSFGRNFGRDERRGRQQSEPICRKVISSRDWLRVCELRKINYQSER